MGAGINEEIHIACLVRLPPGHGPEDPDVEGPMLGGDGQDFPAFLFQQILESHNSIFPCKNGSSIAPKGDGIFLNIGILPQIYACDLFSTGRRPVPLK
jgi:hypothetical protein